MDALFSIGVGGHNILATVVTISGIVLGLIGLKISLSVGEKPVRKLTPKEEEAFEIEPVYGYKKED